MDTVFQSNMCRICMRLTSKRMLIGLFEHIVQTQSLAEVISLVGAVEVQQADELPKLCCKKCLREVEAAYKLRILCQKSDVKLRSNLPNNAAVVKKGLFSDNELKSLDPERFVSSDKVLAQKEVDKVHSLSDIPNKAAAERKEPFSDDEMNSLDPEDLVNSDEVLEQIELEELNSFAPDAVKHEFEEITIEETRITDDNFNESDRCSESKNSVSDDVEGNSFDNQKVEVHVSKNKRQRVRYYKEPKIFDKYPAVKFSCCGCISSFDTTEELRSHGREKHCDTDLENYTLKERQCDICFKVLRHSWAYDFHKRNVRFNYRCKICDEILITLKQAINHYRHFRHEHRLPTADEALICCGCKMQLFSTEELRIHSETIHLPAKPPPDEKKPVTCNICYRNYSCKDSLRRHKVGYFEKPRKNYPCKQCEKSFGTSYDVKRHEKRIHAK